MIRLLELTPYSREEYNSSFDPTDDPIERARRFAVRCWQGFGSSNKYKNGFRSGIEKSSPFPPKYWNQIPEVLREASERLKNAQIENQDAMRLIERYDKEEVFIYADPPYLLDTRKGYLYEHEMTDEQHIELLKKLLRFRGKVMISGYDNELYNQILVGWNKAQTNAIAECSVKRTETIWMNYEHEKQLEF